MEQTAAEEDKQDIVQSTGEKGGANLQYVQERFEGQRKYLALSRHIVLREELRAP